MEKANNKLLGWGIALIIMILIVLGIAGKRAYEALHNQVAAQISATTQCRDAIKNLDADLSAVNIQLQEYTKLHPEDPDTIDKARHFIAMQKLRLLQDLITNGTSTPEAVTAIATDLRYYAPKQAQKAIDAILIIVNQSAVVNTDILMQQLATGKAIAPTDTNKEGVLSYLSAIIKVQPVASLQATTARNKWVAEVKDRLQEPYYLNCKDIELRDIPIGDKQFEVLLAEVRIRLQLNCQINELLTDLLKAN